MNKPKEHSEVHPFLDFLLNLSQKPWKIVHYREFRQNFESDTSVLSSSLSNARLLTRQKITSNLFKDIKITMESEKMMEKLVLPDVLVNNPPIPHGKQQLFADRNAYQKRSFQDIWPRNGKQSANQTLVTRAKTHCSIPEPGKQVENQHFKMSQMKGHARNIVKRDRKWKSKVITIKPTSHSLLYISINMGLPQL